MNKKSSNCHQVVSEGNKTDIKQRKSDNAHQISSIGVIETSKSGEFLIFCQDSAQKCFQDKTLHNLNCSTDSGN